MNAEDLSNYSKTYLSYKGKFSGEQGLQSWIHDNIENLLGGNKSGMNTINVLSVGAGTGDKDKVILNLLCPRFSFIHYTALEPSPELADICKDTLTKEATEWNNKIEAKVVCMTSEEFVAAHSSPSSVSVTVQKYDLIHIINTFYYVQDVPLHIKCYHDCLKPGGKMLVINSSANVGFNKILNDFRKCIPSHIISFAEDVEKGLKSFNAQYDTQELRFIVDLTTSQEDSPSGNLLLDFRTGVKDIRKTLSEEIITNLFQRMRDDSIDPSRGLLFESFTKIFIVQNLASQE